MLSITDEKQINLIAKLIETQIAVNERQAMMAEKIIALLEKK